MSLHPLLEWERHIEQVEWGKVINLIIKFLKMRRFILTRATPVRLK